MKIALPFFTMIVAGLVGFAGMQMVNSGYELTSSGNARSKVLPPAQLLERLSDSESALSKVYENLASISPEEAVKRGMAHLQQIDASYELLGKHQLNTETERAAQMCVMRSYYLAQTMLPQLKDSFQCQANRVVDLRADTHDAAVARVLLFCSKHDLTSNAKDSLLTELVHEADSYESKRQGVGLYSVVAHEFWKNGDAESAEIVLKSGINQYKQCTEKLALVDQLIEQGHRQPPAQKFTPEQYARMQRALANASAGSAVRFRS